MTPDDLRQALPLFDAFVGRFAPLLGLDSRVARADAYLRGLLLDNDDNKTAEAIALKVHGDPAQVRMTQVFLAQSPWADAPLRAELARWVAADLGAPDGMLILDESSFPKCGTKSVGVARQYCGETGKLDNCQVAVYVAYAGPWGQTLLDTRLYLPKDEWAHDPARRREAGVPEAVVFRTKPELGLELLTRLAGVLPHAWVTFDEGYGRDTAFLAGLEELGERYIGEVPKDTRGWLERPAVQQPGPGKGRPRTKARVDPAAPKPQTAEALAAGLPADAWQRLAFRQGSKGTQHAYFAAVRWAPVRDELPGAEAWLVLERSCDQEAKLKYYVSNAASDCPLLELARAGHRRYPVEECFLRGKDELGLGDYEVQGWRGWHHHQTLVLLALWFLLKWGRQVGGKKHRRDDAA